MRREQAETLGARLAGLRRRHRISQQVLARESGLSRGIISIIERGLDPSTKQPPNPRTDTLRRLASALAVDGDGRRDDTLAEAYYRELMDAAGYLPPLPIAAPSALPAESWDLLNELRKLGPAYWAESVAPVLAPLSLSAQRITVADLARQIADGSYPLPPAEPTEDCPSARRTG